MDYEKSVDLEPFNLRSRVFLGRLLYKIGNYEEAVEHLQEGENIRALTYAFTVKEIHSKYWCVALDNGIKRIVVHEETFEILPTLETARQKMGKPSDAHPSTDK